MRANFEKALRLTISPEIEGGFSNQKTDRGGPTNLGVTLATLIEYHRLYPEFGDLNSDGKITIEDVKLMDTIEEVAPIYQGLFWDKCQCNEFLAGVDYTVFDSAANHGPGNAAKILQISIKRMGGKIDVDGDIGPITISKANSYAPYPLVQEICRERQVFYQKIVSRDPSQSIYIKGWMNRIEKVRRNAILFLTEGEKDNGKISE